ncbi:MAG: phosphotransferase family protein, partial [Proteobacteria bacterium]|nr:phosphotransferase family protein [Pseudomonadota bacterium]
PLGHVLESAHDMGREYKIISSLGPTDIPVAPSLGLCRDKTVNEADFYVMRFVEGRVYADSIDAVDIPEAERRGLGFDLMDILIRLHAVDPDQVGLGDLGKKQDYAARQIKRWTRQWESTKTDEIPEMEDVCRLLKEDFPEQIGSGIVHGDYRMGNMIVRDSRVAAVLDWELCTLGDTLADVGYFLNWWYTADEVETLGKDDQAPTAVGGFPTRDELTAYYEKATGRDLGRIGHYRALSYWRLAAIAQGVYYRYIKGAMGDTGDFDLSIFKDRITDLAGKALELVQ